MTDTIKLAIEALEKLWLLGDEAAAICNPALAALRAQPSGWQPIETAPKDGTPIFIANIGEGIVYDLCNGHFEVVPEDEEDGPWDIRGGEPWCSYEGRQEGTYFCCWLPGKEWESRWRVTESFEYTHWMPATPPPGEQPAQPKCKCSMRTKLVGDGCSVCNPELARELAQPDHSELVKRLKPTKPLHQCYILTILMHWRGNCDPHLCT